MSIEFKNKGDVVTLEYRKDTNCHYMKTAKDLHFKAKEMFSLDTKIEVQCTEFRDVCVVGPEEIDKKGVGFASDIYRDDAIDHKIVLIGYCYSDEDVTIPKGKRIAYIECFYKTNDAENYILKRERKDKIIYEEEGLLIKSTEGKEVPFEIVQEPNGKKYLRMELSND